ncbi:MAG TPA: hypothetical protein VMP01_21785 [Pirellulaceae bacterium]|nr:hypothetical protein [Pirellulaceae bacterium]
MFPTQVTTQDRRMIPCELPERRNEELQRLRTMSKEERSQVIIAVCQLAADIEAGKRKMGLPPTKREPIPRATLEFFRQRIANGRR